MTPENSDASGPAMTTGRVSRAVIEGQALSRGRDAPKVGGRSGRPIAPMHAATSAGAPSPKVPASPRAKHREHRSTRSGLRPLRVLAGVRRSGCVGQAAGMDLRRPIRPAVEGVPDARGRAREGPRLQNEWGGRARVGSGRLGGWPEGPGDRSPRPWPRRWATFEKCVWQHAA